MNKRTGIILASSVLITATAGVAAVVGIEPGQARAQAMRAGVVVPETATTASHDDPAGPPGGAGGTTPTTAPAASDTAGRATAATVINGVAPSGPTTSTMPAVHLGPATRYFADQPQTVVDRPPTHDASCGTPRGEAHPVTQAQFEAKVEGAWLLCSPPSVFGTQEAGVEIRSDHRWSKLDRATDGRFVRKHGWGNEGSWESIDTSSMNGPGHWQLNLDIDGSGTVITEPVFGIAPTTMRLNNEGVYVADYVPVPRGQVVG